MKSSQLKQANTLEQHSYVCGLWPRHQKQKLKQKKERENDGGGKTQIRILKGSLPQTQTAKITKVLVGLVGWYGRQVTN